MKIIRCSLGGAAFHAVLEGERVHRIAGDLFGEWSKTGETAALGDVELLPPVEAGNIFAVGFNYRDHAEEFGHPIPETPNIFLKPRGCLAAHGQPVLYPKALTAQVDYEAELVAVIGKPARHVSREDALQYVLGYTCGNDVTARDLQRPDGQWAVCKGFDTFGPVGPWIETEAGPAGLDIEMRVNGEVRQSTNTDQLIFDVPYLVHYLSQAVTLQPGDLIFTGTTSGVGPVRPGDVMEVGIAGIGTLRNPVVAEA